MNSRRGRASQGLFLLVSLLFACLVGCGKSYLDKEEVAKTPPGAAQGSPSTEQK
jgi:hypothetical protein